MTVNTSTITIQTMEKRFRVIIVGASVAGLTLALALERAGIDYIVLEGGSVIAPQLGGSLGLHPHALNILDQLGVWESITRIITPIVAGRHFNKSGHCFSSSPLHEMIHSSLGYPIAFLERRQLIQSLYDALVKKSNVLTGKRAKAYMEHSENEITVLTEDGETYDGNLLVGADGVHSTVRNLMAQTIAKDNGDMLHDEQVDPLGRCAFTSEYKAVFGISHRSDDTCPLSDGLVCNAYEQGLSAVVASGAPGYVYWFVFVRSKEQTCPPNVPHYTYTECAALMQEHRSHKMTDQISVGDIWDARVHAVLVALEEGMVTTWSHGRVVLVGDAVHKATINAGLGGNLAIEGVVHLANLLNGMINGESSLSSLPHVLAEYQNLHLPRAQTVLGVSSNLTRLEAQETFTLKILSRYIMPLAPDRLKNWAYGKFARGGPVLNFLPVDESKPINNQRNVKIKV
ncbi:hypothetical protein BX600DRAFT_466782 [Xylariales sp. PMI_506]|nr:hypothetical protein BX600DRAFT_466782 [Xylariales sp. PMI_506]